MQRRNKSDFTSRDGGRARGSRGRSDRRSRGRRDRNDFSRDERRDSGRRSYKRDRDDEKEMHKVICDKCGKSCEVPFKPTSSKPVYCSECFRTEGDSSKGSRGSSKELKEINEKLDAILEILKKEN